MAELNDNHNNPNPENPETFTGIKLDGLRDAAAGTEAVLIAAQHVLAEMDPLRAAKALFAVNQIKSSIIIQEKR